MVSFCINLLTLTAGATLVLGCSFKQVIGILTLQASMMVIARFGASHRPRYRMAFYLAVPALFAILTITL